MNPADVVADTARLRESATVPFTVEDAIRDARAHVANPELIIDSQHIRKVLGKLLAEITRLQPK